MENNKKQIKEQVASGIWRLRFGIPSTYTPTAHRKSEIKMDALSQLSKTQTKEPQLPFSIDSVQIKHTNRGIL